MRQQISVILSSHIKSQHKEKKYECKNCDKEFTNESSCRSHNRIVHEGLINSYKCDLCQYSATHKINLSVHIKNVHLKEKLYPCNICDYKAALKITLSRHVEHVHAARRIICTDCNKSIKQTNLAKHRKVFHSGIQPQHKCNICTFQTIYKSNLMQHIVKIHQKGMK